MHFAGRLRLSYITDFVWHEGKLIVEADGGQHAEAQRVYDERRKTA